MTDAKRLFLAAELSVATTRRIAEASQRLAHAAKTRGLEVAWVPPTHLHVTLAFLGWTHPETVDAVRDAAADVVSRHRAFDVEARGVGAFPSEVQARVLWAAVLDPKSRLAALADELGTRMEAIGFPRGPRPFVPHVTLGRVGSPGGAVAELYMAYRQATFGTSPIRTVNLYESVTSPVGSIYRVLAQLPLVAPERQTRGVRDSLDPAVDREEPETHGRQDGPRPQD